MSDQITYLRSTNIVEVLGDGFAHLYEAKPKFPVLFLAEFLKNYVQKRVQKENLQQKLAKNQQIAVQLQRQEQEKQQLEAEILKAKQQSQMRIEMFGLDIKDAKHHEQILIKFCQWIEKQNKFTGVYLGQMRDQTRTIDLEKEDSLTAHIDQQAPKIIKFIAASHSHHKLMVGKVAQVESVVGRLVTGKSQEEQKQPEEEQVQTTNKDKHAEVYIQHVEENKELKFYKFPKLGAFYAIPIKLKNYLQQRLFDANLLKVQAYKKTVETFEKQEEERQAKFKEQYNDKMNFGVEENELQQMQKQFEEQEQKITKPTIQDFQYMIRDMVLCVDTLGQDRLLSDQQRQMVRWYGNLLGQSWSSTEKSYLDEDIEKYLKLCEGSQVPQNQLLSRLVEQQDRDLPLSEQVDKYKDNQKLAQLQLNTLKLQRLKQYMCDEKYVSYLETLLTMHVLKYGQIMGKFMIFMGFSKESINFTGSNVLNWKQTKKIVNKNNIIQHVKQYNPRGSKPTLKIKPYALWPRIINALENYQQNTVASYNIYLAFILRFLQIAGKVRIADRQARVTVMKAQRIAREQRIKEAQQKQIDRQQKLEVAKGEAEQKEEQFDEQGWILAYAENNPIAQIGQQIADEIDVDLPEQQLQDEVIE